MAEKLMDLTAKRFGKWTVIERSENSVSGHIMWKCRCDCGTVKDVRGQRLRDGGSKSCGCAHRKYDSDITGQRFGMLTAIEKSGTNKYGGPLWKCKCDCGNEKIVPRNSLISGNTKSCGCMKPGTKDIYKKNDLTGERIGKWTVIEMDHKDRYRNTCWKCKNDDGTTRIFSRRELMRKKKRSVLNDNNKSTER